MRPIFYKTFGGLTPRYYFRHLMFGKAENRVTGMRAAPEDLNLVTDPAHRRAFEQAALEWENQDQPNILSAMIDCIRSADNYIYIESQFFISQFGQASKVSWGMFGINSNDSSQEAGIGNTIADELAIRIGKHIDAGTNFHVYLVIPVHPEGSISDGSVWKQQWMALETISHGKNSLIKQIKGKLREHKRSEDEWSQYLTVLNMRSYGVAVQYARDPKTFAEDFSLEIGRYVLTEQIYIHSKLMIVDDAVAIIGSANINDRSLSGHGDTEIAAVIVDSEGVELRDLGDSNFKVQTRKFARELRRYLWSKHFGFEVNPDAYFETTERARRHGQRNIVPVVQNPPRGPTTEEKIQSAMPRGSGTAWQDILDKPCHPKTIKAIQAIAEGNKKAYETVFPHVPRNDFGKFEEGLARYSLPYPCLGASAVRNEATSEEMRYQQALAYSNNLGLTAEQAETYRKDLRTQHEARLLKAPETTPGSTRGVVPPPLNDAFMTATLLAHQQAAAKADLQHYGRRYVLYQGNKVHDIEKAMRYLQRNTTGYFVLAPLSWGEKVSPTRFSTEWGIQLTENMKRDLVGTPSGRLG